MWIFGIALALLVGLSLGMLGGGGSILTLPILKYVFGLGTKEAITASLFVVGTTSAFGAISHARAGRVRWKTALVFGAAGMLGGGLGGLLLPYVPDAVLLYGFTAMMLLTAIAMLRGRKQLAAAAAPAKLPLVKIFAEGIGVGVVTGLVGAGGGFLVVPALTLLGGLPMEVAVGTSLVVITMKQFAAFSMQLGSQPIDWTTTLAMSGMAVLGSFAGGRLVGAVSPEKLRRAFGWFVVAMAIYLTLKELPAAVQALPLYATLFVDHIGLTVTAIALAFGALVTLVERGRSARHAAELPSLDGMDGAAPLR